MKRGRRKGTALTKKNCDGTIQPEQPTICGQRMGGFTVEVVSRKAALMICSGSISKELRIKDIYKCFLKRERMIPALMS